VRLAEPPTKDPRLPSSKNVFQRERPQSFFQYERRKEEPQKQPPTELNQTKTLLRENFTANSRLSEYVEPGQNIGKQRPTRANSRQLDSKFEALWRRSDQG